MCRPFRKYHAEGRATLDGLWSVAVVAVIFPLQVESTAVISPVKKGYENTLSDLIKLTFDHVSEHVAKEASIVSAIAQS